MTNQYGDDTQIRLTKENLIKEQKLDPESKVVKEWLDKGETPQ